jgi:signal transduction histidine kinase
LFRKQKDAIVAEKAGASKLANTVSVQDFGIGIAESHHEYILNAFIK